MISIVGLGPGSFEALTIGTINKLKDADHVIIRTVKHPTVDYLKGEGIVFETCDAFYEKEKSFNDVYKNIAEYVVSKASNTKKLVYAVPGHPLVAESSVIEIINICKEKNIPYEIVSAVSFIDIVLERLEIDPIMGFKLADAFEINKSVLDKRAGLIVTQVYDKLIASEVKLSLSKYYGDEAIITFIHGAGIKDIESIRQIPLYELDRQKDIDHLTTIYIPPCEKARLDFFDLIGIMETLRGKDGCPWDKEQDHKTLTKSLIEETYEVVEAIEKEDPDMLLEELGDVLFQVVFHAELSREEGNFDIYDVIEKISEKMIHRHPHVFKDVKVKDSSEVLENWDEIKKEEQGIETYTDTMCHVPKCLPGLMRAEKVQSKAKKAGFQWDKVEDAMDKVIEEFNEVKSVYKGKDREIILDEVGDLIFAVVNVARYLEIDPEAAVNSTTEKFIKRFKYIEDTSIKKGLNLNNMTLKEMDDLWNEAKLLHSLKN